MKDKGKTIACLTALVMLICTLGVAEESPQEVPTAPVVQEAPKPLQQETTTTQDSGSPDENPITTQDVDSIASVSDAEAMNGAVETMDETADGTGETEDTAIGEPRVDDEMSPIVPSIALSVTVTWKMSKDDDALDYDDEITLQAEIAPELDGLWLQWQVATKATENLKEDEPEWADISGAHGYKHKFAVKDGMQSWRWRLCITTPDGESTYSDEIMLPAIGEEAVQNAADGEIAPEEEPLPVARIIFSANAPEDEIIYGTEIQLTAEIENPREGMLLQWQHMPADAELAEDAWISVEGATESSYAYMLDEKNEGWLWRLLITTPEANETNEAAAEGNTTDAEEGTVLKEDPPQEESTDDSETLDEPEIATES